MARLVDQSDGPQAVTDLFQEGPVRFFERVFEIESAQGGGLVDPDAMAAVHALSARLGS
jgi:hypothetical protein